VQVEKGLYGAWTDELLARVRLVPDEVISVMLIGHNPGLHVLPLVLASSGDGLERLQAKLPTAALATLELPSGWNNLGAAGATLIDYVVPKQLR
jgi:phosphohistidine phosphatase